jgi:hypothetical protein
MRFHGVCGRLVAYPLHENQLPGDTLFKKPHRPSKSAGLETPVIDKESKFNLHTVNYWLSYLNLLFQYNLTTIDVLKFVIVIDVYAQPACEKIKIYRTASKITVG